MSGRSGIEARWIDWDDGGDEIVGIRRRVLRDELGWTEDWVRHDKDPEGIHLCAFDNGEIMAAISAYVYEPGAPELAAMGLADTDGPTVQIGKRVELPAYRGRLISAEAGTSMLRQICESLVPSRFFLAVPAWVQQLIDRYARRNFVYHAEVGAGDKALAIMKVEGKEELEEFYLKHRDLTRDYSARGDGIPVPSLVRFLVDGGREGLLAIERLAAEIRRPEMLSPRTEMSRLIARNEVVLTEQRSRLASAPFPPPPASLLDIGTGSGEYLAAVAGTRPLAGYHIRGVEPVAPLLSRARSSLPDCDVREGTAYATGEPGASHDVVTANFMFAHLRSPDLLLLETRRVLRPGGLLYVVDVDDRGFSGPEAITRLIHRRGRAYTGDRLIMNDLPKRAEEFGFRLVRRFSTALRSAAGPEPRSGHDELLIGERDVWNILFSGCSQADMEELLQEARDVCSSKQYEISMVLETHVYRLTPSRRSG